MQLSPLLLFHISAGVLSFGSGATAISFRKGSRRHGVAGRVFVAAMAGLAASGATLALLKSQSGNVLGGALTLYLVATGWIAARKRKQERGAVEWIALATALVIAVVALSYAREAAVGPSGLAHDYPLGPYLFLGSVAILGAAGDARLLFQGDILGARRIARHLWRMCFAFFIASASIFLARETLFPAFLGRSGALLVLSFLPLAVMVFWLLRLRLVRAAVAKVQINAAGTYTPT